MTALLFDVVIAGAGPAGATAALCLARAGAAVALVDPFAERGIRVGESLAPAIREPLGLLGLWDRFAAAGHRPAYAIRSAWGSAEPQDQDHIFNPHGNGWHVDRRAFDRMLVEAAEEAGAHPIAGTVGSMSRTDGEWTLWAGGFELRARHVVDATGRPARIARRLGGRRIALDRLVGAVISIPRERTTAAAEGTTLVEACPDGWWYSARTPDDRLLLAYMTDADLWLRAARRRATLAAALEHAPLTRARLHFIPETPPRVVAAGSAYLRPAAGAGWLAAGDAAMAVDPLSGSGVLLALRSGIRVAAAIEREWESDGSAIRDYNAETAHAFATYATARRWFYAQEQRFPNSEFWKRREKPREASGGPARPAALVGLA
ncbi:MAG TPA: tryptophan 7-halogenase [Thermoanaerobaculia bacterium]|nr:tryptophan 7-halogenase [Thermoanaerobaculia bacterium]